MNDENGDEQTGSTIQKSVSLDVTTAVTKAVSEANAAVVGVVNIQNSESFGMMNELMPGQAQVLFTKSKAIKLIL